MLSIKNPFANWRFRMVPGYGKILGLILLGCFILAGFSIKSYGASYDEILIQEYSKQLVQAYKNLVFYKPLEPLVEFYDLRYYGSAYWILARIVSQPLLVLFPALDIYDGWHILTFACFLLGVWCLFCLVRRYTPPRVALVAALLYLVQPLLWGHGIMNSKDTPFATFFLATILMGVRMVEEQARTTGMAGKKLTLFAGRRRIWVFVAVAAAGLMTVDLVFDHFISRPLLSAFLSLVYSAAPGEFLHTLFLKLAPNSGVISQVNYLNKAIQMVNIGEFAFLFLLVGWVSVRWFVGTRPGNRWIVLAGIVAGLTVSIRVLGPAAMGLVAIYAILKLGRNSIPVLGMYLGVAIIAILASWPYLWSAPLSHFLESMTKMADFPWTGRVRFEGKDLQNTELPWYYLPKLIAIQLTLPSLILAAAGLLVLLKKVLRHRPGWELGVLPILWFGAPVAMVLLLHPKIYDNFRQFLFILPPLFFFAAAALEVIFARIRSNRWSVVLGAVVLLPGLLAGIWLHPYEYVYYNGLVGWTGHVERSYEGDYWYTSLCEAARYVSRDAPDGAEIAINDSLASDQFRRCLEKKLAVVVVSSGESSTHPDYSVVSTRNDGDLGYFPEMQVIHTIGRGATVFTVIKKAP